MTALGLSAVTDVKTLAERYMASQHYFTLIASVLNNRQVGQIYSDDRSGNYFVVHQFGFADLLESEQDDEFDESLYQFLINKKFAQQKLRWYQVPARWVNVLKSNEDKNITLVERAKLIRNSSNLIKSSRRKDTELESITLDNFDEINRELGMDLDWRFWPSKNDFLRDSFGVAAYVSGKPAAICYACAIENEIAEVDVFTKAEFRENGLGKVVAAEFVNMCIAKNIRPHWDCYSNNLPSVSLAAALNFIPTSTYNHAIISK